MPFGVFMSCSSSMVRVVPSSSSTTAYTDLPLRFETNKVPLIAKRERPRFRDIGIFFNDETWRELNVVKRREY